MIHIELYFSIINRIKSLNLKSVSWSVLVYFKNCILVKFYDKVVNNNNNNNSYIDIYKDLFDKKTNSGGVMCKNCYNIFVFYFCK